MSKDGLQDYCILVLSILIWKWRSNGNICIQMYFITILGKLQEEYVERLKITGRLFQVYKFKQKCKL